VGLPAKSGISGLIILVVPKVMGMAVFSPPVDRKGNSVRGVKLIEAIADKFNLNVFSQLFLTDHHEIVDQLEEHLATRATSEKEEALEEESLATRTSKKPEK
jgi:glutaminase